MNKKKKRIGKLPVLLPAMVLGTAIALGCFGCGFDGDQNELSVNEDGSVPVGNRLLIEPLESALTLSQQFDTLAADGLYYATWTIGEPVDYENSDGDTAQLYDAQLYLLLGEYRTAETAAGNMDSWLATAKENYEVISEEDVTYNFVTYHVVTYNCVSETNPYDRGISAFASAGTAAVCAEFICQADFADDPAVILTDFLEHCTYPDQE